jgi:hypothetical protein
VLVQIGVGRDVCRKVGEASVGDQAVGGIDAPAQFVEPPLGDVPDCHVDDPELDRGAGVEGLFGGGAVHGDEHERVAGITRHQALGLER